MNSIPELNNNIDRTFEELLRNFEIIEKLRQYIKKFINDKDISLKTHEMTQYIFDMIAYLIKLPFNNIRIEIKAIEMIGDIFIELKSFEAGIIYYFLGVIFIYIIEIVFRCS